MKNIYKDCKRFFDICLPLLEFHTKQYNFLSGLKIPCNLLHYFEIHKKTLTWPLFLLRFIMVTTNLEKWSALKNTLGDMPQTTIKKTFDHKTAKDRLPSWPRAETSCCSFLLESSSGNTFLERTSLSQQNALHIAILSDKEEQVRALLKVKPWC